MTKHEYIEAQARKMSDPKLFHAWRKRGLPAHIMLRIFENSVVDGFLIKIADLEAFKR